MQGMGYTNSRGLEYPPSKPQAPDFSSPASSAEIVDTGIISLRMLTFNVWGVPPVIGADPNSRQRFRRLRMRLPAMHLDLVILQEMWRKDAAGIHCTRNFPFSADCGRPFRMIGGSGLMLLSRHPVISSKFYPFKAVRGLERLVRKGFLYCRLDVLGMQIDVVNVHFLSEPERINHVFLARSQANQLRLNQLSELGEVLNKLRRPDVPQIIAGDFNIDQSEPEYEAMAAILESDLGQLQDQTDPLASATGPTFEPGRNRFAKSPRMVAERLDYIWLRNSRVFNLRSTVRRRFIAAALSDHYGVEAHVVLRRTDQANGVN